MVLPPRTFRDRYYSMDEKSKNIRKDSKRRVEVEKTNIKEQKKFFRGVR